jgi:hypothetical protein
VEEKIMEKKFYKKYEKEEDNNEQEKMAAFSCLWSEKDTKSRFSFKGSQACAGILLLTG